VKLLGSLLPVVLAAAPTACASAPPCPEPKKPVLESKPADAGSSPFGSIASRDETRLAWLERRLDTVLPKLMKDEDIDAWLVIAREYNEDPTFWSLVAPTTMAARRTTILAFFRRDDGTVDRLALGGGSQGGLYAVYRDPEAEGRELYGSAQWGLLRKLLDERNPKTIAVNTSREHAFADGLSSGLRARLELAIGETHAAKLRPAETLAINYIYQRVPEMRAAYVDLMTIAHSIIQTAFSSAVITPGTTTTRDVVLYMRERVHALGLGEWFEPTVDLQRRGRPAGSPLDEGISPVIERGDVLHCDFGVVGLGLKTDTQHVAYVLREGEEDAPAGLRVALENANRLQDILLTEMKPGRTGNDVLAAALSQMRSEQIDGSIYTHPIGDHGHGAGPLIGLWDRQQAIPARGDVQLRPETWYAIELQATTPIPEWDGQPLRAGLEEDAVLTQSGTMEWILERQASFHLVR
jgi:hypothetical protein